MNIVDCWNFFFHKWFINRWFRLICSWHVELRVVTYWKRPFLLGTARFSLNNLLFMTYKTLIHSKVHHSLGMNQSSSLPWTTSWWKQNTIEKKTNKIILPTKWSSHLLRVKKYKIIASYTCIYRYIYNHTFFCHYECSTAETFSWFLEILKRNSLQNF